MQETPTEVMSRLGIKSGRREKMAGSIVIVPQNSSPKPKEDQAKPSKQQP